MTRVFEKLTEAPGTHAIVIGVGDYPAHASPLDAAAKSALEFARWLVGHYRNPTAELATVDLLLSSRDQHTFVFSGTEGPISIERPSPHNLGTAVRRWREAADTDENNLTIFYFVGHGHSLGSDTLLLLDGFIDNPTDPVDLSKESVDFDALIEAMRGSKADRQIYLVDCSRVTSSMRLRGSLLLPPLSQGAAEGPSAQVILYATDAGKEAYAEAFGETLFYKALMDGLSGAQQTEEGAITASTLSIYVRSRLQELASKRRLSRVTPVVSLAGDLVLHFPNLPAINAMPGPILTNDNSSALNASESDALVDAAEIDTSGTPPAPNQTPVTTEEIARSDRTDQESNTSFVSDEAERERDDLGRAVLAIGLARRLHRIWRSNNDPATSPPGKRATGAPFVVHIDAPWGGGKTSFANYVGAVLNPFPRRKAAARFLRDRYPDQEVGGIFLSDPPPLSEAAIRAQAPPPSASVPPRWARRPWIIVNFNAWEAEHCTPPWWLFSQTIRAQCFEAISAEGSDTWDDKSWKWWRWVTRKAHLSWLYVCEVGWRLANPKVRTALITAIIGGILLLLLKRFGVWGVTGEAGKEKADFLITSSVGLILAGMTGISAIWGIAALFTESIAPGTNTLAERLSLGSGDPLARFREHFHATMRRLRRPVLVVIDDLDRCKPDFVVDLVRGVQTLLRSPRVVFIVLGDRNWIEQAFEQHHSAMKAVNPGLEQAFGARFVEKAIQISFVLPSVDKDSRAAYLRHVLLGARDEGQPEPATINAKLAAEIREVTNRESAAHGLIAAEPIVEKAIERLKENEPAKAAEIETARGEVKLIVGETLAINAAVDERVERAATHQLQALAPSFPANPRQVKRIVNAITIYWAVALQRPGLNANDQLLHDLAIWMMIMHEWPKTWRSFVGTPELVDSVIEGALDPSLSVNKSAAYVTALTKEVERIRDDLQLVAVLRGGEMPGARPLTSASARILAELTPLDIRAGVVPAPPPVSLQPAAVG